jgi:hypothetical protein
MKSPILGQAYVARSINAADNRMVNLFPEVTPPGSKDTGFLNRAPGLKKLVTVGDGPIRAVWANQSSTADAFIVSGNQFYKIDLNYNVKLLGNVTGTGPVSIADNGAQIFLACNPDGFIYNKTTGVFQQITDPDFAGAVTVGYLDGYFVFNQPNSQIVWVCDLFDGLSISPLNFASAESSPDTLASLAVNNREVWLFGTNSIEVWYDAATAGFPLAPIQGAYNEVGCLAAYSVAKLDNSLFWLGADARGFGMVYRNQGYTAIRVSTHAIEYAIQNYSVLSDATAYTYQQEGHSFYVLTFPTAGKTWVYDVATQMWHERAGFANGEFTRHRSNCQMSFNNATIVGDYQNGNVYALNLDVYDDNVGVQKWLRSWRALPTDTNTLNRTAQHTLQLDAETGVGLNLYPENTTIEYINTQTRLRLATGNAGYLLTEAGDILDTESGDDLYLDYQLLITNLHPAAAGYIPQVMLRWSDDGGHTWSSEHWTSMGKLGEYATRTFWRRLGMTVKLRDRVYEISGTDPVKISIMAAELHLSAANS